MRLEDLPEIKKIPLKELEERVKKGESFVFAERISFEFESRNGNGTRKVSAVDVGKDVAVNDLERLGDVEGYPHIVRENGKVRDDPIEVFYFDGEKERGNFFQIFGKGVELVERVHPMAQELRVGVLEGVKSINKQLMHLLREINLEEKDLERRAAEQVRLTKYIQDASLTDNLNRALEMASRDPVTLTYYSYAPEAAEHGVDVGLLAGAVSIGANIKDDESLLRLARAGFIHDAGDEWFKGSFKADSKSSTFKRLYPIRDFLIPRRMLVSPDGSFIRGVDAALLEAVEHHHTRREGRRIDLEYEVGNVKRIAYISRDARENLRYKAGNSDVFKRMGIYMQMEEEGKVDTLEEIQTIYHQLLSLAEYWVTAMNANKTKLNAITQLRKIEEAQGRNARSDFVQSLKQIITQKYK